MTSPDVSTPHFRAAGLDWIVPDWPAPGAVRAFTTTRRGPAGESFDLGNANPRLEQDRMLLRRWLSADPCWLQQVHGTAVHVLGGESACGQPPRADAVVAFAPEQVGAIRSADCLPILFCDRDAMMVAAAHAGWRGLGAGVIEATLAALPAPRDRIMAWLGPAIGAAHYQVGADVLDAFGGPSGPHAGAFISQGRGRWLADLPAIARSKLRAAGVVSIHGGDACTYADSSRFFSHRRGGDNGRMATLIWLQW